MSVICDETITAREKDIKIYILKQTFVQSIHMKREHFSYLILSNKTNNGQFNPYHHWSRKAHVVVGPIRVFPPFQTCFETNEFNEE